MKCRACGAPVNYAAWVYFTDETEGERHPKRPQEELCSSCLTEAKIAFAECKSKTPQVIEYELKNMWKEGLKQEGDPLYGLTSDSEDAILLIDLENFSLGTEE